MDRAWDFLLQRYDVFLRDVLDPAAYRDAISLHAAALQVTEPIPFMQAAARAADFRPVPIGWTWGPRWSTCWFRLTGTVPAPLADRPLVVRFSTDTEALLWDHGAGPFAPGRCPSDATPFHGLDVNRDTVRLPRKLRAGEPVEFFIEAACNHLFGDRGLQWDNPDTHRRWSSDAPGRFERCELAAIDEPAWLLRWHYAFALDLAGQLPAGSARAAELFDALQRATNAVPDNEVHAAAPGALDILRAAIARPTGSGATLCHAVGHAHIDTAWLWPVRETKRKCLRTFSTVLRNMERFPHYRFLCSQTQQYAWVKESAPELFEQIRCRVAEGRWEPGGSMWIEPDCTCPSGESLIRQILHADRAWRGWFGDERGRQRHLYLPDTFGFPNTLPQVMRHAGLDTFITNKLHWNQTTEFPHTSFTWRGIDGSEVLAHLTPGKDYNATMTPRELRRGEETHKNKDIPSIEPCLNACASGSGPARWLQPFGFGDGGGGPTDWSIVYADLANDCDGLPRVRHTTATEFCDALRADAAAASARGTPFPVWDGELYLEMHRGTYTTHARLKQSNRELEELLRLAEVLIFAGPSRLPVDEEHAAKADLDRAWKLLLLNQFHDILPGSSITWVYEDAARDHSEVRRIAQPLVDRGLSRWSRHVSPPKGCRDPVLVFNPSGAFRHGEVVEHGGRLLWVDGAMPLGIEVIDGAAAPGPAGPAPVHVEHGGRVLANDRVRVEIDPVGRVRLAPTKLGMKLEDAPWVNDLVLYEDRPRLWDAWDIDPEYVQKGISADAPPESMRVVESGPLRASIEITRPLGARSRITQTFRLQAATGRLDIDTIVDWHEEHRFLRALFPTGLRSPVAAFGTPFGFIERPTTRGTPKEQAMFEVPFQRWFGLADGESDGRAFGIIAPDKYGASSEGDTLGLSLLRSTRYPDPEADKGRHTFRYSILSGTGTPESLLRIEAERACRLLLAARFEPGAATAGEEPLWSPIDLDSAQPDAIIESLKPAHDDDGVLVLRVVTGSSPMVTAVDAVGLPIRAAWSVDALERPAPCAEAEQNPVPANMPFRLVPRPFQIFSLALSRAD